MRGRKKQGKGKLKARMNLAESKKTLPQLRHCCSHPPPPPPPLFSSTPPYPFPPSVPKLALQLNNKLLPSPSPFFAPFSPSAITLHTFHYLGGQAKRDVWGRSDHYHHLFPLHCEL